MKPHRMHLHGPWQYEWLSHQPSDSIIPRSGRVKTPIQWQLLFGDLAGKACFRRRFHKPTNLEPHERVYLVLEDIKGRVTISIDDTILGIAENPTKTLEFDITPNLMPFNELGVEIEFDPAATSRKEDATPVTLWKWVAIEIRNQTDDLTSNRTLPASL